MASLACWVSIIVDYDMEHNPNIVNIPMSFIVAAGL